VKIIQGRVYRSLCSSEQQIEAKGSSPCHYETRLAASDVQGKQH
jgi:hypothetical protein